MKSKSRKNKYFKELVDSFHKFAEVTGAQAPKDTVPPQAPPNTSGGVPGSIPQQPNLPPPSASDFPSKPTTPQGGTAGSTGTPPPVPSASTKPQNTFVTVAPPNISATVPGAEPPPAIKQEPPNPHFGVAEVEPEDSYMLEFRSEDLENVPTQAIPELQQIQSGLTDTNSPVFQQVKATHDKYKNVYSLLSRGGDLQELKKSNPEVASAIDWMKQVKAGALNPYADPERSKAHVKTLWELGAYSYATRGFTIDPSTEEGRKQFASRYMDVFNKALGDKRLDPQDLDIVYNNFSKVVQMPPQNPATVSAFSEWWNSENVSPLMKAALMIGVPLAAVGVISGLWKGFSLGNVLVSLLGAGMAYLGFRNYSSFQPSNRPAGVAFAPDQVLPQGPGSGEVPEFDTSMYPPGTFDQPKDGAGPSQQPPGSASAESTPTQGAQTGGEQQKETQGNPNQPPGEQQAPGGQTVKAQPSPQQPPRKGVVVYNVAGLSHTVAQLAGTNDPKIIEQQGRQLAANSGSLIALLQQVQEKAGGWVNLTPFIQKLTELQTLYKGGRTPSVDEAGPVFNEINKQNQIFQKLMDQMAEMMYKPSWFANKETRDQLAERKQRFLVGIFNSTPGTLLQIFSKHKNDTDALMQAIEALGKGDVTRGGHIWT